MLCFIIFIINICIHLFVYFFDYPPRPLYKVVKKIYTFFITFLIIYISKITSNARSALRVILRPGAAKRHIAYAPLVPKPDKTFTPLLLYRSGVIFLSERYCVVVLTLITLISISLPPTTHLPQFHFHIPLTHPCSIWYKIVPNYTRVWIFYYCQVFDLSQIFGHYTILIYYLQKIATTHLPPKKCLQ